LAITRLRKIHIAQEPEFIYGKWEYELIAVFNRFIAILSTGRPIGTSSAENTDRWIVLKHISLAPGEYIDSAWSIERIFVVTSYTGDVFVWEPFSYG